MTYSQGPRLNAKNNPGNAKWCEDHQRLECKKLRRRGQGPCHAPAIRGTDACKIHGGVSLAVATAKGEARITAWSALGITDGATTIDAGMAVLGMLQMSWLRVAAFGDLLRRQVEKEGALPEGEIFDPDNLIESTGGLIGYKYGAAGSEGNIYAVSEEVRGLVALEAAERDRVVRFAKVAHDMGISDKLLSLAERWGDVVVGRIMIVLGELSLTPEQEALVPALIQAHLGQIEISTAGDKTG